MAEPVRPPAAATADPSRYTDPRAHELRADYLRAFGGAEIPVPVESIAEDLLGLRIEESDELAVSGILVPSERRILLNAAEATHEDAPIRRHRFTIAHELGHWVCHVLGAPVGAEPQPSFCRAVDLSQDADRAIEREANVFAAELLMPEPAVRRRLGRGDGSRHGCGALRRLTPGRALAPVRVRANRGAAGVRRYAAVTAWILSGSTSRRMSSSSSQISRCSTAVGSALTNRRKHVSASANVSNSPSWFIDSWSSRM